MSSENDSSRAYWKKNKNLILILLTIWAVVSYGFGILFAEALSKVHIGKLPASFWWAQQGAIYVFVILIFVYAKRMDTIDREHSLHEEDK